MGNNRAYLLFNTYSLGAVSPSCPFRLGEADFLKFSGKRVSLKILGKKTGYVFVDRKLEKIGTKFHGRSRRRYLVYLLNNLK